MTKLGICRHCAQQFIKRRTNHLYCSPSCRTKACYNRNGYAYVTGHYERVKTKVANENLPGVKKQKTYYWQFSL
jgi:hypothetical protein